MSVEDAIWELYECETCSAKPGAATLCVNCYERRQVAGGRWRGTRPNVQTLPRPQRPQAQPSTCPRCGLDLEPDSVEAGDVFLRVDTGYLYKVTGPVKHQDGGGYYAQAERINAPPNGFDPGYLCALFPSDVKRGHWLKVKNHG